MIVRCCCLLLTISADPHVTTDEGQTTCCLKTSQLEGLVESCWCEIGMVVHLDTKTLPTDENDLWRLSLLWNRIRLKTLLKKDCVVPMQESATLEWPKNCEEFDFCPCRGLTTVRSGINIRTGVVETCHRRRRCQNETEYSGKPPARLQLRILVQSFASPRRIESRVYLKSPIYPGTKTYPCLIFFSDFTPEGSRIWQIFYRAGCQVSSNPPPKLASQTEEYQEHCSVPHLVLIE